MLATSIEIFETFEAPFVTSVEVIDPGGASTTVFSGPDTTSCGSALTVSLPGALLVAQVKIHTATEGYEEIDAVRMTGNFASPPAPSHPSPAQFAPLAPPFSPPPVFPPLAPPLS